MSDLGNILTFVGLLAAAGFAGAWGRQKYRNVKRERDQMQAVHDAIDAASQRLADARRQAAGQAPINLKQRTDFERTP